MVGFIYTWLETVTTGRRAFVSQVVEEAERICFALGFLFTVAPESELLLCRAGIVKKNTTTPKSKNNNNNAGGGLDKSSGGLGGEGELDAAGGVALVAGRALQAAVVVQVAGAGCALAVQLSMGELDAFHVHLNLCCAPGRRERERTSL